MSNPLVSIIIPTKNSSRTLEACLESINNQSYKNNETIIVDQESADTTRQIAAKYNATIISVPESKFYSPPTKSRNTGAKMAKGGILYHLDSDMSLSPDLLKDAVGILNSHPEIGALIVHEEDVIDGFWSKAKALERRCYWGNDDLESARIVRRSLFEQVGGYDEGISSGEDFDIHRRYRKSAHIGFCKEVVYHYQGHLSFFRLVSKKFYYGRTARLYFAKRYGSGQSIIAKQVGCYIRHYTLFLKHPIIGASAVLLRTSEITAGMVGMLKKSKTYA